MTSVVFTGPFVLTLNDGQTLRPVFISRESGAMLNLGDGTDKTTGNAWTMTGNSPSWDGTINVLSGNSLTLATGVANPAGAWSETNAGAYGTVILYDGATLKLPARAASSDGQPQSGETKIGRLRTVGRTDATIYDPAVVEVGANQNLIVENGIDVNSSVSLNKRGTGTITLLANGTEKTTYDETTGESTTSTDYASFNLGKFNVTAGTLRVADGTVKLNDASFSADSLFVAKDATLDINRTGVVDLKGSAGDVVLSAADGSTVKLYLDENGQTTYVANTFNTYMEIGATTLDVNSSVKGSKAPTSWTVFSTKDVGQTNYKLDSIDVYDNILGKNYVVDRDASTADSVVLKLVDEKKFASTAVNANEGKVGALFDRLVANENYTDSEYAALTALEGSIDTLSLASMTGEIHASTVGFFYMNNMTATQDLFDHLRNNALVAYSGSSAVAPMDYGASNRSSNYPAGNYPLDGGYNGGAAKGSFDKGPLYYNTDTNSYGPGVVPIQSSTSQQGAQLTNGIYNGERSDGLVGSGSYDLGWTPQFSTLATMRGQASNYGDPGTLIYSAWAETIGGTNDARKHKTYYGYDAKQAGLLAGLDLFGSCDCRFGAYYGFQRNELKNNVALGKVKTNEHTIGLYHQFGDENVYNIGTIHAGYGRFRTTRVVNVLGEKADMNSKYDTWNAGITIERGANFSAQPFTFSPYAQLDYNYFLRPKYTETASYLTGYRLHVGKADYHSVRGQIGGRIALDMYPGEMQIRIVGSAAYIHEFLNANYGKTWASLQGFASGGEFKLFGNSLGRDWALVGLGIDWAPIPALNLFFKGNYLVNKYTRYPYSSAGLKFRW